MAERDLIVRLAFGTMAAQTLRAAVRLKVWSWWATRHAGPPMSLPMPEPSLSP
ncbi:hypothetical protein J3A78_007634 [Streptomyces sp. PvR006]|nr:hypothetical protein [Streptomyces sp. PvR006]